MFLLLASNPSSENTKIFILEKCFEIGVSINVFMHLCAFLYPVFAPLYCSYAEKSTRKRAFFNETTLRVGEILLCSVNYAFGV